MEPKGVVVEDKRPSALKAVLKRLLRRKLIRLVLVVVVVIILACVGWKIWADHHKKSPPSNDELTATQVNAVPKTVPKLQSSSACDAKYDDNNLCQFATTVGSFNTTSYSAKITVAEPGSVGSNLTLLNDGKGDIEVSGTSNGSQVANIYVSNTDYLQKDNGVYQSYLFNLGNVYDPATAMNIGLGSAGLTFKRIGTTSCGSLRCFEYSVTDTNSSATQYIWFDTQDYLLQRWQEVQGNTTTNMTITYQPVAISAPPQNQVQIVW